jgi:hypothetical protein
MPIKKFFFIIALCIVIVPAVAHAGLFGGAFGGQVIFEIPCDTGLLLTVLEPGAGAQELMWNYGELPYLSFVPPHIGQWLLGMTGLPEVCAVGPLTIGIGNAITFHGSSL